MLTSEENPVAAITPLLARNNFRRDIVRIIWTTSFVVISAVMAGIDCGDDLVISRATRGFIVYPVSCRQFFYLILKLRQHDAQYVPSMTIPMRQRILRDSNAGK